MADAHSAQRAYEILNDPLVIEARKTVTESLRDIVCDLPLEAREKREFAVAMMKAGDHFFRVFDLIITNHQLLQAEITDVEQVKARHDAIKERLRNV